MPTTFVSGDLFDTPGFDALAHGCNCAGAMGKGVAVGLVVFETFAKQDRGVRCLFLFNERKLAPEHLSDP